MKPPGTYKIRYQRAANGALPPEDAERGAPLPIESLLAKVALGEHRTQRIVDSLCDEIREGGESSQLRIRRIFSKPREVFRLELDRPDLGYQRTTLLGRDALEALLAVDDVRSTIEALALTA